MKKISYYDNKNVIHDRLRYYRKLRGLSQEEVVAQLQTMNVNIDQQMLSRIENNHRIVTDYELACLCQVLNVSERDMLADFYQTVHK
jgi:transcriptional regulator with XRE-family HTH domain